jgi:hypothetical protein
MVAYTGMVTFQTLVYLSTMCWLIYTIYALDGHTDRSPYRNGSSLADRLDC